MKKQNGITLIALIITIIVMVILAGVVISSVISDEGIIEKTQEAIKNEKYKEVLETIQTSIVYLQDGKKDLNKTKENILALNSSDIVSATITDGALTVVFTNGPAYIIDGVGENDEPYNVIGKVEYFSMEDNVIKGLSAEGVAKILELKEQGETEIILKIPKTNNGKIKSTAFSGANFAENKEACALITKVEISEGITEIGSQAFYYCYALQEVILPETLEKIGSTQFGGTKIKSIKIPNNVTEIGDQVFLSCSYLESIELPENITTIKYNTFMGCYNLKEIVIPSGVTKIEERAFKQCSKLEKVEILGNIESIGDEAFSQCQALKLINIPDGIKSIGAKAFATGNYILDLIIPSSIEDIGADAFSGIKNVQILKSSDEIISMANYNWSATTSKIKDINGNSLKK